MPILGVGSLDLGDEPGRLNGRPGLGRQGGDDLGIHLRKFGFLMLRPLLLGQVEPTEEPAIDQDGGAQKGVHRRMMRGKAGEGGMLGEVLESKRTRLLR